MERKASRTPGRPNTVVSVGKTRIGFDPFAVVAGPCGIESEAQINAAAEVVAAQGTSVLRAGAFKQGSSPYSFRGLGHEGVRLLEEAGRRVGLPTCTQVIEARDVEPVADHIEVLEVGAGSMQDFELLRAVGRVGKPVMLRRGPSATLDEWLWAAEYILAEGNDQIVLVERGIRTFTEGDTLDITAVPTLKELTHLPVMVDPSHTSGGPTLVQPLALAAQGVGADGVIVEVHPSPGEALTDGPRQLEPAEFATLMTSLGVNRLRNHIDQIDRQIVRLLSRRQDLSLEIGRAKATRGMLVRSPDREAELLGIIRDEATHHGLDPAHVHHLFELILVESRQVQHDLRHQLGLE
jgi:3-deoxy-7-phosphoheptulonate synthase